MIKKTLAMALVLAFAAAALAGCSTARQEEDIVYDERENPTIIVPTGEPLDDMFSVRHIETGEVISLLDSYEKVTAFTGEDERDPNDFTDENIYRTGYWDMPGIYLDYYDMQTVTAIRLMLESGWEGYRGVYFGMPKAEAVALFEGEPNFSTGLQGGILLSYDESRAPIDFDQDSPYRLLITFDENDLVDVITMDYNFALLAQAGGVQQEGGDTEDTAGDAAADTDDDSREDDGEDGDGAAAA